MATMIINELNEDLVNVFRELANKFGATTQLISNQATAKTAPTTNNLSQALLTIPQLDGYDNEDIFASDNSPMNDIEWIE